MRIHHYRWDSTDALGRKWCVCRRLKTHPVHEVPDTPPEVAEIDSRRMGEREEEDQ